MEFKSLINQSVKNLIALTSPKLAIAIRYFIMFKKFPNLKHPATFNEKINSYKFMDDRYNFQHYADKVTVKEFVAAKIGHEYIIPNIYVGETLPPLEDRAWTMPYIIKMNNSSGWNIPVRNEQERNWPEIESKIARWSKQTFGRDTGETHYSKIKPMVLVEKFISETPGVLPKDYKIFVFNGKTEFIEVVSDRENSKTACFYNKCWVKLDFSLSDSTACNIHLEKPKTIDKIIELAEILSADFPFVRVDFYDINGKIFFGEMTFTPSAGFSKFTPNVFDVIYGQKLLLA